MVTRNSSPMFSSNTEPTITVASSIANWTLLVISLNSLKVSLLLELMFMSTPRAPARFTSSNKGLDMARSAATLARSDPEAVADPIIAMPFSDIRVRTSAKSTFINPGTLMTSAMPATAPCKTLLEALNASNRLVSSPSTVISFSFGTIINESTDFDSASIPTCAKRMRLPS